MTYLYAAGYGPSEYFYDPQEAAVRTIEDTDCDYSRIPALTQKLRNLAPGDALTEDHITIERID